MKEYFSSVSPKGQVTLPAEVRTRLGIKPKDKIVFIFEGDVLTVKPARNGLQAGFRSIPALKYPRSLEEMTEIAAEEHAEEAVNEASRP